MEEKIIESDNKKGNPYHSKEDGRFVSKGEEGTASPKKTTLASLFGKGETAPTISGKGRLVDLFNKEKTNDLGLNDDELTEILKIRKEWKNSVTLQNYKEKRREFVEDAPKILSPEEQVKLSSVWDRVYKNSLIGARMKDKVVYNILCEGGHLQNQFESKTTGGYLGFGRYKFAVKAWGVPEDYAKEGESTKLAKLEKYGCLADANPKNTLESTCGASAYGDCYMAFKKDKMQNTTTLTMDDSLGSADKQTVLPSQCNKIDEFSFKDYDRKKVKLCLDRENLSTINDMTRFMDNFGVYSYIELQFHKPKITADDVESLYMNASYMGTEKGREIAKAAEEKGIKLYLKRADGNVELFDKNKLR